mgnify:CR=1 FL=1
MNILFFLKPKSTVSFIYSDHTVRQGLEKMRAHGYTAIPVIHRDGRYAGTVSEGDFLWHILDGRSASIKKQEKYKITDIMRPEFNPAVTVDTDIDCLLTKMTEQNFVPIVDDRNVFMGIVTRKDIIKFLYSEKSEKGAGQHAAYA